GVIHRIAEIERLHYVPRHDAARQDAPVHLRQAEGRVIGGDRKIAGADLRERTAEAEAIDHRDRGLREGRKLLPAPLVGGTARLVTRGGVAFGAAEIEADVLAGGEGGTGAGDDENLGLVVDRELV